MTVLNEMYDSESFQLLESIPQPCMIEDLAGGKLIYANSDARNRFGLARNRLGDVRFAEILTPHKAANATNIWRYGANYYKVRENRVEIITAGQSLDCKQYVLEEINLTLDPSVISMAKSMSEVIVHRFRSPLNGMSGFAEILAENSRKADDSSEEPSMKDFSGEIEAIQNGMHTLGEMLDIIKDFTNPIEPLIQPVELQAFIDSFKSRWTGEAAKIIEWKFEQQTQQRLQTDPILLQQILEELLNNALEARTSEVDNILFEVNKNGKIAITNWGTTIPRKNIPAIYQPFFTTKARHLGLGLPKALLMADALEIPLLLQNNSKIHGITFELDLISANQENNEK